MKLSYKLLSITMGIVGLCSQANAGQIRAYNPQNKFYQKPFESKRPRKEDYLNNSSMKAILEKDEEILEEIEIKNRKQ